MKKSLLGMLAFVFFCGIAAVIMACGDDDKDEKKDSMEALCHVTVSEDVLKVADITVHYLDAKGNEATERMNSTEWKKRWKTTTLPARLGVWRCNRFSRNLVTHLTASPSTTYRDLYLYCAQHTLGSHVHIVNSANFGNLYTTGPQEFFEKK